MSSSIPTTIGITKTASLRNFFTLDSALLMLLVLVVVLLELVIFKLLEVLGILLLSEGGQYWRNENDWGMVSVE
jgi:hypothetical protein